MGDPALVAVDGAAPPLDPDDRARAGGDLGDRVDVGGLQPVTYEVPRDLRLLLQQGRTFTECAPQTTRVVQTRPLGFGAGERRRQQLPGHSHTRTSLFGPEEQFHRYLGYCFAIFTMPNTLGLSHELVLWNSPGKAAAPYAVGGDDELHAFMNFHRPEVPLDALRNPGAQRDLVATVFADVGWEVPAMVDAMREADDLFFDTAGQIRMPHWSRGRVALVGDAAYAPSFLTGQGASLALVGAYMLADALSRNQDHTEAFAATNGTPAIS